MAITAIVDRVDVMSLTERLGVVRSMTTKCRVAGIQSGDFSALVEALYAGGVPLFGTSPLDLLAINRKNNAINSLPSPVVECLNMLVLADRRVSIESEDPGCFDVTLEYEHVLDGPYQNLFAPINGTIYGKMTSALQQKTTNFFRKFLGQDELGQDLWGKVTPIVVGHTYPATDAKTGGTTGGKWQVQGGEVNVMFPAETYKIEGFIETTAPWDVKRAVLWHVNPIQWLSAGPFEWLCTEVQYEIIQAQTHAFPSRYKFMFEWQRNTDTWNPTAVFIDKDTHRPPAGLTYDKDTIPEGVVLQDIFAGNPNAFSSRARLIGEPPGFFYVQYYPTLDFNAFFGALFEGWVNIGG